MLNERELRARNIYKVKLMSSGVFVIKKDGTLIEMQQSDYDSEDMLQNLLAKHPNLLAGNLIDDLRPRKWLLVKREYGIPDKNDSVNRWSLDHLFLDQDGIPTLVEVKRSSDTRIRREVVGQMLEYAANSVQYWDINRMKASFEARCSELGLEPKEVWARELDQDEDYEEYWNRVNTNLQVGKIRLLFIADEIPLELRRIVEFLNEQMHNVEVLALEIKQYVGQEQKTLIPRIYGQSAKTQARKGKKRESRDWDEPSFLKELGGKAGPKEVETVEKILGWARKKDLRLWWGKGFQQGSCYLQLDHGEHTHYSFSLWTSNRVEIQFYYMASRPVYDSAERQHEIRLKLNQIPGVSLQEDVVTRLPSFPISVLENDSSLILFIDIWDEYFDTIRASQ